MNEKERNSKMAKTQLEELNRNIYDIKNKDDYDYKIQKGITKEIVEEISKQKNDPDWMREIRLKALETYNKLELPTWGPDLSELNMDEIATYVRPKTKLNSSWDDVPEDIKNTFDKLGIPEAERTSLAGVGAQYDSEVVYHSMKEELLKQGVIYTDMETAVREYPEIVKEHFMKCVPINDHKFVALHAAVWSGGSFVYIPKGVKLEMPLQSYFRLNSPESGQFEHTLIIVEEGASLHFIEGCSAPKYNKVNLHAGCVELYVKKNAYLRYSTIENWSKNMMNLNTKKAIVEEGGQVDWVTGSFGSKISMLYPLSILNGKGAKTEYTGISFAGAGQNLDTGFKVIHNAPNTSSVVNAKSISKNGGKCTYRSLVRITENAQNSKSSVSCESLMLDDFSVSDTIPVNDIRTDEVEFSHEAKIGKISDKTIFYLMSRGLSEEDAKAMIVRGFAYPISKELPGEYAVEMNNLINLELEGAIG
ncbi:MAG: Fe-S cluster assembly protein SufB [Clostridia bacterium]|nr:Fe-S cluster assembly protein SufB [Clostridia bacterium]